MKFKFITLSITQIFALTACGGGSNDDGTMLPSVTPSNKPDVPEFVAAQQVEWTYDTGNKNWIFKTAKLDNGNNKSDFSKVKIKGGTIVALGDSLTTGYGAQHNAAYPFVLQEITGQRVINHGVSGDTSADLLKRVPQIADTRPSLVLLGIGGNDFLRQLDETTTRNNIVQAIQLLKEKRIPVVLIAEPTLISGQIGDHPMYAEIAQQENVPLVSGLWSEILSNNALKSDQVHANDKGYRQFAEKLARFLDSKGLIQNVSLSSSTHSVGNSSNISSNISYMQNTRSQKNPTTDFAVYPAGANHAYARYGFIMNQEKGYAVSFYQGVPTDKAQMPTQTAQYDGHAFAFRPADGSLFEGKANIKADFANKSLNGTLSDWKEKVTDIGSKNIPKSVSISANIKDNTFLGNNNQGMFYGPNADNIAGAFADKSQGIQGTFGGHK
ncbi:MAG: transferrin-binding protein-like solute binding protein [Neisseriaceae bacterium]|nr:transferrin-binding protein-like solute binding protein [Neisseriaceae bacterium]